MDKKTLKKLTTTVEQILQLKGLIASQELQVNVLKRVANEICQANIKDFVEGEYKIEGLATVKCVQSPARLVWAATGKPLTPVERADTIPGLSDVFVFQDINVKKIRDAVERGDEDLKRWLRQSAVRIEQEMRYDLKPIGDGIWLGSAISTTR